MDGRVGGVSGVRLIRHWEVTCICVPSAEPEPVIDLLDLCTGFLSNTHRTNSLVLFAIKLACNLTEILHMVQLELR